MIIEHNENLNSSQIDQLFKDDLKCLEFLAGLKWVNGFTCRKCGNDNSCEGKVPFSKRCTRCKNEESATANTLFHNIKFPVHNAFYITYEVCKNPNVSTFDLARDLDIRQLTCWNFKHKVDSKIAKLKNLSSTDSIDMLSILVGNHESLFI